MTMKKKPKQKQKQKKEIVKERDCEDWCFICKDGGELILCDYQDCLKVYHKHCVEKDDSSSEHGKQWTCDRHSCLQCHKPSFYYCYCCPNGVCKQCISTVDFAPVRGKKGLCNSCLDLIMIVEEKINLETEEGFIDLEDRNTHECLFLEYWDIIKAEEGLTLDDVYAADATLLKGPNSNSNKSKKSHKKKRKGYPSEDSEVSLSDRDQESDDNDTEDSGKMTKRKASKVLEFIGWGSKPLIEFLRSVGKDTTEELSQHDAEAIILRYIQEKKLFDPRKKRKIFCDEMLETLFRKKCIQRNRIYQLLEAHFVRNLDESDESEEEDKVESNSHHNKNYKTAARNKKQKMVFPNRNSEEKEVDFEVQESCFASIVAENIKLAYLSKSLVEQLLNEPESFEGKVMGSFVKVRNGSRDITQRSPFQILQVIGINQKTDGKDNKREILLRLSNMPTDVSISVLSDNVFTEDEIDDLREKVEKGTLPKLNVAELEQKAKCLHMDITKHWIEKEPIRLQRLINVANEKGWRRELNEYLDQLELLKKPAEQERLIKQTPKVIAELVKVKVGSADTSDGDAEGNGGSPQSNHAGASNSPSP